MLWVAGVEEGVGEAEGRLVLLAGLCRAGSHGLEEPEAVPGEGVVAGPQVVAGEGGGESRQEEQERRGAVRQAGLWGCGRCHGGWVGAAVQEPGQAWWCCGWSLCLVWCRVAGFMWRGGFPFLAFRWQRVSGCGFQFWLVAVVVLGKCVVGVAVGGESGGGALAVVCRGEVGCSGRVGDAQAPGQSPWGQLCRGGVSGFPCWLQGELRS